MNYLEKMDLAIRLIKEALLEAEEARGMLAGELLDSPMKFLFKTIQSCGLKEGKRYKATEILRMINVTDMEIERMGETIPRFCGTREIRFGKLLTHIAKYNIDGFTLKEGTYNGCKTYRIERV